MPITKASGNSVTAAAKGDLVVGNATNDSGILGVGANDTVLTADSSTATGLKWGAVASNATLSQVASGTLSGASTTITGLTQDNLQLVISGVNQNGTGLNIRLNSTGSNYFYVSQSIQDSFSVASSVTNIASGVTDIILTGYPSIVSSNTSNGFVLTLTNCKATGFTTLDFISKYQFDTGGAGSTGVTRGSGYAGNAAQITSIQIISAGGTFSAGSYRVIGG